MTTSQPSTMAGLSARRLTPDDLPALLELCRGVTAGLVPPDLCARGEDDEAFFLRHLDPAGVRGQATGLFVGDEAGGAITSRLVACALLGLPGAADDDHPARPLGFSDDALDACAELAGCLVAAPWRGRGLQRKLVDGRLTAARAAGRRWVVALVSLHNHRARHNLMARGLRVVHTGLWRGLQRQWLLRDLQLETALEHHQTLDWVRADNFGSQVARRGRLGVAEMRAGDDATPWIGYTRQPSAPSGEGVR